MVAWPVVGGFLLAGAGGALIRFLVSSYLNNDFPYGTLLVNLVASALLGFLVGADVGEEWSLMLGVAGLGALSTWSTAANEAAVMARREEGRLAVAYLALLVLSGIVVAWIGIQLGRAA